MPAYNTEKKQVSFFSLKAKTSDTDPTPYFGKSTKTGDKWEITEKYNAISGTLIDIKHLTYDYEGETKHKVELSLKDNDGSLMILGANFNNLTYSLLNALSNCEPEKIDINVWLGKANIEDGKEGKRYAAIGLKNNRNQIKWKYGYAQIPHPTPVDFKNKKIMDDTEVIEFWINVIENEIKPQIKTTIKTTESQKSQTTESQESDESNSHDDLPF